MKTRYIFASFVIFLMMIIACEGDTTSVTTDGTVRLTGFIFNRDTNTPIDSAIVEFKNAEIFESTLSNSDGSYAIEFEISGSQEVTVVAIKETFIADSTTVLALGERTVQVPVLQLEPTEFTPALSGEPANIYLQSMGDPSISIQGAGSIENTKLTFAVVDSFGRPIGVENSVDLTIRLAASPGGGEFVTPTEISTGVGGTAETYIFSGTRAGTVQIYAEATHDGRLLTSEPVPVVIHGGLPDQAHFTVGSSRLNIPAWRRLLEETTITALVGDKYANPVRPGTAVYFTTTGGGVIGGSGFTNDQGVASSILLSGLPDPIDPILGPGWFYASANTADENQVNISHDVLLLYTSAPIITITPTTFNVPHQGSVAFQYTVSDFQGHPMCSDTRIRVGIQGRNAGATGNTDILMPDVQSSSWTNFGFSIVDTNDSVNVPQPIAVRITVIGESGRAEAIVSGIGN